MLNGPASEVGSETLLLSVERQTPVQLTAVATHMSRFFSGNFLSQHSTTTMLTELASHVAMHVPLHEAVGTSGRVMRKHERCTSSSLNYMATTRYLARLFFRFVFCATPAESPRHFNTHLRNENDTPTALRAFGGRNIKAKTKDVRMVKG